MVNKDKFGFIATIIFLIVEYGRPQEKISVIGVIRPAMVAILLILISWIARGGISIGKNKQATCMILFLFLLASYIPFARNNFWAFAHTRGFLMYFPVFISIILYVNSFDRLKTLINIWIGLMIYISINVITHGAGEGSGGSFLQDENDYSLLLNMMLPFSFFLFLSETKAKKKIFYAFASSLAVISIVISFSRGGFVGLICVGFIMWLYSPKKILTLIIICIAGLIIYFYSGEKYIAEMSTVTDTEDSTASERIETWKSAWRMFLDKPLGVGGGNFKVWFPQYQGGSFKRGMWGRVAHSLWFQLLSELGIFGVFIYGSLLFYNLKDIFWMKSLKNSDDKDISFAFYLSLAFLASFAGYFSSGSFLSVLYYPHYFYMTAMIIVTRRLVENKVKLLP